MKKLSMKKCKRTLNQRKKKLNIAKALLAIFVLTLIIEMNPLTIQSVQAAVKSNDQKTSGFFVGPGGVLSSFSMRAGYNENYTISGNKVIYNKRFKWCWADLAYSTDKPTINLRTIVHRNSSGSTLRTFSNFKQETSLMEGGHDYYDSRSNNEIVRYDKNSGNQGLFRYDVTCSGALVPIKSYSLQINL